MTAPATSQGYIAALCATVPPCVMSKNEETAGVVGRPAAGGWDELGGTFREGKARSPGSAWGGPGIDLGSSREGCP